MIDLADEDVAIIIYCLRDTWENLVKLYSRGQFQRWNTVPKPSLEMCELIRSIERLRMRLEGRELPEPLPADLVDLGEDLDI